MHLSFVDQALHVVTVRLEDLIVQLAGLVNTVFQNQELNVILFDLKIFWMIAVERSVISGGFVEIAGGKIEITQHAIVFGNVGEISPGLAQEGFRLILLALLHEQAHQRGAWRRTLRIHYDGVLELLFGFRQTVAGLEEAAQSQLRVHGFRIDFRGLLEVDLRLVG